MLRQTFATKLEADIYLAGQKIRKEKGYLTRSERTELETLLKDPNSLVEKKIIIPPGKTIVTNIRELKVSCQKVEKNENIKEIVQDLKDTLNKRGGYGLAANQIGINKSICYIKVPQYNPQTKKFNYTEVIAMNPRIIEQDKKILVRKEECLSFPGIAIDTDRYIFCTVEYENENRETKVGSVQDLEAFIWQHEVDHLNGKTIFDKKHRRTN